MPTRPSTLALALAAAFGAFPVHQAVAAGCVWTPASGIWGIAGNWASCGGQVPALADSASVAAGKTASVTNLQSVQSLGNAGTINIDGSNIRVCTQFKDDLNCRCTVITRVRCNIFHARHPVNRSFKRNND